MARPDVISVTVLVITERELVIKVLPGLEDGFGNEIVKSSLTEREDNDAELLEGEGVNTGHVALIIVVKVMIMVVVCPPGRVLVSVVKALEVMGGAGLGGVTEDGGAITVVDVLVKIVVDPPGIVLVTVIKVRDVEGEPELNDGPGAEGMIVIRAVKPPDILVVIVVRLLDIIGGIELDRLMDGVAPMTVVEVLVQVVVCPPGIVLVSVLRKVEVTSEGGTLVDADETPPIMVVVIIVKVVVAPPGVVLVIVVVTLEVVGERGLDRALVGIVEDPADVGDGFDMMILGVMVDSVLNRLGGVMLFIHSVVPLMTEK
jgi:hypothetical protein